ncbi:hypothetical protein SAMN05216474_2434 [Lishizhenia tianjinensis]|uniref:Uncharacterized protein n=1 Tax=Lishizhenia tianjinensis TaxID=477690 RepID=A0A1I7B073_9FLAO|nr:hypothetical protein [Lishizhenia tianjinensis]SFT80586.1 hypothetical protein SAMN05216474_2434 [Lishizhenia tianjinensis]
MKNLTYIIIIAGLTFVGCRKKIESTPGEHPNNFTDSKTFETVHKDYFKNKESIRNLFSFDNKLYITTNNKYGDESVITVLLEDNTLVIPEQNIGTIYDADNTDLSSDFISDAQEKDGIVYFGGDLEYDDDEYLYFEYNVADNTLNKGINLITSNPYAVKSMMKYQGEVVAFTDAYANDLNCLSCPNNTGPYPNILNINLHDVTAVNDMFYLQTHQGRVYYTNVANSTSYSGINMASTDTVVRMFEYNNTLCAIGSFDNGSYSLAYVNNNQLEPLGTNSDIMAYLSKDFTYSYNADKYFENVPKVRVINDDIYMMGKMYLKNSAGEYDFRYATTRYHDGKVEIIDTDLYITDIAEMNGELYGAVFYGAYLAKLTF